MEDISTAYSGLTCADILSIEEAFEGGGGFVRDRFQELGYSQSSASGVYAKLALDHAGGRCGGVG